MQRVAGPTRPKVSTPSHTVYQRGTRQPGGLQTAGGQCTVDSGDLEHIVIIAVGRMQRVCASVSETSMWQSLGFGKMGE